MFLTEVLALMENVLQTGHFAKNKPALIDLLPSCVKSRGYTKTRA